MQRNQPAHIDGTKYRYTKARFMCNACAFLPPLAAAVAYSVARLCGSQWRMEPFARFGILWLPVAALIMLMRCVRSLPFFMFANTIAILLLVNSSGIPTGRPLVTYILLALPYGTCAFCMAWTFGMGQRYWLSPTCESFTYLMALAWYTYSALIVIACIPLPYFLGNQTVSFVAAAVFGAALSPVFAFRRYSLRAAQKVVDAADILSMQLSSTRPDAASLCAAAFDFDKALDSIILPSALSRQRFASPELRYTFMAYVDRWLRDDERDHGTPLEPYMGTHFPRRRDFSHGKERLSEDLSTKTRSCLHADLMEFLTAIQLCLA